MINFTITNDKGDFFNINPKSLARFITLTTKFKRLKKTYTTSTGTTIIYGQRSSVKILDFTIELDFDNLKCLLNVLNTSYEYTILYTNNDIIINTKFYLTSELDVKKIYNADGGLYTLSGTFEEV